MAPRKRRRETVTTPTANENPSAPTDGPIFPLEIVLIIASFIVPKPLPVSFNYTPFSPVGRFIRNYFDDKYSPGARFKALHRLSQVSKSFRAIFLPMMATHFEVLDEWTLNGYFDPLYGLKEGEKLELEIVLLDMLDFYIVKHPSMATLVQSVTVALVENSAPRVYTHFVKSLTQFPNLTELHLVGIPAHRVQLLKKALKSTQFSFIHTLTIPEEIVLEEKGLLAFFPKIRALTVTCSGESDWDILPEIEEHCPFLEYLDGTDMLDIIQDLQPDTLPNLKILASRIPIDSYTGLWTLNERAESIRLLSRFRQLKELRFHEDDEGDLESEVGVVLLNEAKLF